MLFRSAVSGTASADKELVQKYVKILLNLEKIPRPDDAANALALAICHAHMKRNGEPASVFGNMCK